jgi:hypothetical protein
MRRMQARQPGGGGAPPSASLQDTHDQVTSVLLYVRMADVIAFSV